MYIFHLRRYINSFYACGSIQNRQPEYGYLHVSGNTVMALNEIVAANHILYSGLYLQGPSFLQILQGITS